MKARKILDAYIMDIPKMSARQAINEIGDICGWQNLLEYVKAESERGEVNTKKNSPNDTVQNASFSAIDTKPPLQNSMIMTRPEDWDEPARHILFGQMMDENKEQYQ